MSSADVVHEDCDCSLKCKLHYWRTSGRGLQVDPRATPSQRNNVEPARANPAWEAGIAGEHRRDGSFMPYVGDHTMNAIHVKEFAERQQQLEPAIRDNHRHRQSVT